MSDQDDQSENYLELEDGTRIVPDNYTLYPSFNSTGAKDKFKLTYTALNGEDVSADIPMEPAQLSTYCDGTIAYLALAVLHLHKRVSELEKKDV